MFLFSLNLIMIEPNHQIRFFKFTVKNTDNAQQNFLFQLKCFSECRLFFGCSAPRKINSDDSNLVKKIVHVETFSSTCPQHFSNSNFALWMKKKKARFGLCIERRRRRRVRKRLKESSFSWR